MGILSKEYICPNEDCSNIEEGKKGQICPKCGIEFKKMASFQANNLRSFKLMNKDEEPDNKTISKNVLVNDKTSGEEMKAKEYIDNDILPKQEINIDWDELEVALSSEADSAQIITLKAIIEQNKLIIQQNDLIYRELKKLNENNG